MTSECVRPGSLWEPTLYMAMEPITDLVLRASSRLGRAHLATSNKETLGRPVPGFAMLSCYVPASLISKLAEDPGDIEGEWGNAA